MGDVRNLRPWRKGQSGNRAGRPKDTTLLSALVRRLAQVEPDGRPAADRFADALYETAVGGNVQAMALIFDRCEGKAPQQSDGREGLTWREEALLRGLDPERVKRQARAILEDDDTEHDLDPSA